MARNLARRDNRCNFAAEKTKNDIKNAEMLKQRVDILTNGRNQSKWCFEGYRHILSTDIFAPDGFKTSRIMHGDTGRPAS